MKKIVTIATLLILMTSSVSVLSAQSRNDRNRAAREKRYANQRPENTRELPCMMYDDDEWYVASGASRIKMGGDGGGLSTTIINALLQDCQTQLKMKIKGRYKAVVRDYFNQMDLDAQSTATSHIESAGEMIIDAMLDDTREDCREISETDDSGYATLYMGIQIRKSDIIDGLVEGMQESSSLSSDEKTELRNNEAAFRRSAFSVFDNDKQTNL